MRASKTGFCKYAKNKIVVISFGPFLKGPISLFSQAAALSCCGSGNSLICTLLRQNDSSVLCYHLILTVKLWVRVPPTHLATIEATIIPLANILAFTSKKWQTFIEFVKDSNQLLIFSNLRNAETKFSWIFEKVAFSAQQIPWRTVQLKLRLHTAVKLNIFPLGLVISSGLSFFYEL